MLASVEAASGRNVRPMTDYSVPFATALRLFFADLRARIARGDADEKTLTAYEVAARNGAMRLFPRKTLGSITVADVLLVRETVRGHLPASTRNRTAGGPAAANHAVKLIRMVFAHAERLGLFSGECPASKVPLCPTLNVAEPVTPEHGRAIAGVAWGCFMQPSPDQPVTEIVAAYLLQVMTTGGRRSEVAALRPQDFDPIAKTLTFARIKGRLANGSRSRVLPLSAAGLALNTEIRSRQWSSEWMFPAKSKSGHIADPLKAWARLCDHAGVPRALDGGPRYRLHDVRHGFAIAVYEACRDLKLLQIVMEHRNLSTTSGYVRRLSKATTAPVINDAVEALTGDGRWHRVRRLSD